MVPLENLALHLYMFCQFNRKIVVDISSSMVNLMADPCFEVCMTLYNSEYIM